MRTRLRSRWIFHLLAAALLTTAVVAQDDPVSEKEEPTLTTKVAAGVTITVNNAGDSTDATPGDGICETAAGNGECTLRAAVAEANALAGDDVITFGAGITSISINGQIAISSNVAINGPGSSVLAVRNIAPLSTTSRVFNITNFVVNLSGMTIADGNLTGNGGAINNTGTLTITNCVITDNDASGTGGGIRSTNSLTINNSVISNNASTASTSGGISFAGINLTIANSTIRGNTSMGNGGGMNVAATGSASITNTTISGNTAGASSGGLFMNRGTLSNTTISGNTANGALATEGGGGFRIQAGVNSVSITSCTITGNTAPNSTAGARSGIWHETGTLTIASSIVAANVAQDIQRDGTGVVMNSGFNLIGENTSVTTEFPDGLPSGTNYVGTDAMPLDPMLGPLAYNGGPTFTHAVLAGSLAIDHGNSGSATSDQRGYVRIIDLSGIPNTPGGDGSDIGSFEYASEPLLVVSVSGRVIRADGIPIGKAVVVLTDGGGNSRIALTNPFGHYSFESVGAFETYTVSVHSKSYVFATREITPDANIVDLDFMPIPN